LGTDDGTQNAKIGTQNAKIHMPSPINGEKGSWPTQLHDTLKPVKHM
jgi:hypothetical protein